MYLEMAKRFGGLPLELTPKSVDSSTEELMIPRNTLKETYDQIISDLDAAATDLPGTAIYGKATKLAAL